MLIVKVCYVRHTAVIQCYVIVVADLVQSMSGRKVFGWKSTEIPTDVGANMFSIRWLEPHDFSFSSFSFA